MGYLSVMSDGIADAFLIDLMVAPAFQRQGLGKRLVDRAIQDIKKSGIPFIQVVFDSLLEDFYKNCGFHIVMGGIIDFEHMDV